MNQTVHAIKIVPCDSCGNSRGHAFVDLGKILPPDPAWPPTEPPASGICMRCLRAAAPYSPGFLEAILESNAKQYLVNLRRSAVAG